MGAEEVGGPGSMGCCLRCLPYGLDRRGRNALGGGGCMDGQRVDGHGDNGTVRAGDTSRFD